MVKEVATEIDSLRNVHHPNVVNILGMCSDPLSLDSQGAALGVCIVTTRGTPALYVSTCSLVVDWRRWSYGREADGT
jgi:hypothetical protein